MTLKRPYILTIDDDIDFNRLMEKVVGRLDVDIKTTTNAEDFLHQMKIRTPDICILDLNLDRHYGAGFQLIQAIRKRMGHFMPLIVMSKRSDKSDITNAFELGASDFITKPLDDLTLITKIKHFLQLIGKTTKYDSEPTLPYKHVSKVHEAARVRFNIKLKTVTEFGITVSSRHFLGRGTFIPTTHPKLIEITGIEGPMRMRVHQNWMEEDQKKCGTYLEFDVTNNELMSNVRKWLIENATGN